MELERIWTIEKSDLQTVKNIVDGCKLSRYDQIPYARSRKQLMKYRHKERIVRIDYQCNWLSGKLKSTKI